jgi:hypothetical protein
MRRRLTERRRAISIIHLPVKKNLLPSPPPDKPKWCLEKGFAMLVKPAPLGPSGSARREGRPKASERLSQLTSRLEELPERLYAQHTPSRGEIVIFNRSHREDVLVVRVHALVPKEFWDRRFDHINDFERMLVEEGATILRSFLHIDRDERKKRLQERLDEHSATINEKRAPPSARASP